MNFIFLCNTAVSPTITSLTHERENRTLICVSTGSPATIVSWTKDGKDINIDGIHYTLSQTITSRRSSSYSNVLSVGQGVSSTGDYTCTVSNILGTDFMSVLATG